MTKRLTYFETSATAHQQVVKGSLVNFAVMHMVEVLRLMQNYLMLMVGMMAIVAG
jgi:hypothetical protein